MIHRFIPYIRKNKLKIVKHEILLQKLVYLLHKMDLLPQQISLKLLHLDIYTAYFKLQHQIMTFRCKMAAFRGHLDGAN